MIRHSAHRRAPLAIAASILLLAVTGWAQDVNPIQRAVQEIARRGERQSPERSLLDWVRELSHPSITRREAATRQLIQDGEKSDRTVRQLLQWGDPSVTMRAQRIFEAIHGTSPANAEAVDEAMTQVRQQRVEPDVAASKILELGPESVEYALHELLEHNRRSNEHDQLLADLTVRHSLNRLAKGNNRGDAAYADVLSMGPAAAPILLEELARSRDNRERRIHALWLYAQLSDEGRVAGLVPFVRDSDPLVRREALLAAVESVRAEDFAKLADATGSVVGPERELLANAAARRLDEEELGKHLRASNNAVSSLAAVALGARRSDEAIDLLAERLDEERNESVRESIVLALGERVNDQSLEALTHAYATDESAAVRSAALSSLRGSLSSDSVRACVTAGLFDEALEVRLLAADVLGTLGDEKTAPALVYALGGQDDASFRRRVLNVLRDLIPSGPKASLVGAGTGLSEALDQAAGEWQGWLSRRGPSEPSAWRQAGLDAERIVESIRRDVQNRFFHFDKPELVETERLNEEARKGLMTILEKNKGGLKVEGLDRDLLERLVRSERSSDPARLLAALGTLELDAEPSDMVRLCNAAGGSMVRSLGDRFSRMIISNDAEGKVIPDWLPGLLDGSDKTNGLMVGKKGDTWEVEFIFFDSPAFWQGIRVGDQLLKIGKDFVSELEDDDVRKSLGEEVTVSMLREGWDRPYDFTLVPAPAARRTVSAAVLPGSIGYLRLKQFEAGCSVKVEQALRRIEKENIAGLVFDLRNNPGGTVIDATEIVDKFLPKGKVITVTETIGESELGEMMSKDQPADREYPVVVLVNHSSASASEMTSGSLQGNQRAKVIGETSYGKGIGQSATSIAGFQGESALGTTRSQYLVYLTMMRYYLPPGRTSIHLVGVEPDIPVKDQLFKRALMERIQRVRSSKRFDSYVSDLIENQRDLAIQLIQWDQKDPAQYPEFAELMTKLRTDLSEDHVRRTIRRELRRRLVELVDDETFEKICWDIEEDRVLQRAVEEIASQTGRDLSEIAQYGR